MTAASGKNLESIVSLPNSTMKPTRNPTVVEPGNQAGSGWWDLGRVVVQPIPLGVTFSKASSSKLEHLFSSKRGKRDARALSFWK
jgi:hypothetical protein